MTKFRAIFFDLDDTLCDWQSARVCGIEAAHKEIAAQHPQVAGPMWRENFDYISTEMFAEWSKFSRPSVELRLERTRRVLARLGLELDKVLVQAATEAFYVGALANLRLFDDVSGVLDLLHSRFILGIITNTLADVQRVKIQRLGLYEKVDHVLIASEVGISKPAPEIFHRALEMAGVQAKEFLFVGNSLADDVAGAKAAGVLVAWSNRVGTSPPSDIQPDYVISSLRDLISIVL